MGNRRFISNPLPSSPFPLPQILDITAFQLRCDTMHHRHIPEIGVNRNAELLKPLTLLTPHNRIVAVDSRQGADVRLVRDQHEVELAALRDSFEFVRSHLIVRSVTPRGSMM